MSCYNNNCYLPQPPRLWSRVQNSCSLDTDDNPDGLVKIPYSGQIVQASQLGYYMAMLNKGNVLQYKANSSNLTQRQRYSKIAKGQWVNRNTGWASQKADGFTDPNTGLLKRVGNVQNIAINPVTGQILGPTNLPVTCPQPFVPNNQSLPQTSQISSNTPPTPPPQPQPTQQTAIPQVPNPEPRAPIVIQDGGSLVCSIQENICTGETTEYVSQQLCNLTSDSDVPGPIQPLCWNDGTPTWYPRQRYTMSNSTNKWPYSSGGPTSLPLQSAVRPSPPTIVSLTYAANIVTLVWIQSENCLPVTSFIIYENDNFVFEIPSTVYSIDFYVASSNVYNYYMYAKNNNILSDKSNTESITVI
jgi:hypothetical protein